MDKILTIIELQNFDWNEQLHAKGSHLGLSSSKSFGIFNNVKRSKKFCN